MNHDRAPGHPEMRSQYHTHLSCRIRIRCDESVSDATNRPPTTYPALPRAHARDPLNAPLEMHRIWLTTYQHFLRRIDPSHEGGMLRPRTCPPRRFAAISGLDAERCDLAAQFFKDFDFMVWGLSHLSPTSRHLAQLRSPSGRSHGAVNGFHAQTPIGGLAF